ncbi:type II toxin-antitoxin system RelE/ParE family toxin [Kushneria aurantia]|nr:type II toxin-antitoxin system RelE/ParE family toxin [Kushneria aurantia]
METTPTFKTWYQSLNDADRAKVAAALELLQEHGPQLPRPYADTLKGSRYPNMKELRIQSGGRPLRAFFAFDPERNGIVLCAGNKEGDEKRFYKTMILQADQEYTDYLASRK